MKEGTRLLDWFYFTFIAAKWRTGYQQFPI
jgi:hypothetical protein